jgi:PAS fold
LGNLPVQDRSAIGVAITNHHLTFVTINLALAKMNGAPPEKHLGRRLRDIVGRSASRRAELACERVLDTRQSLSNVMLCEKVPGRGVGCWTVTLCPLIDRMGDIRGIGHLVVEIADRRAVANARLSDGRLIAPLEALQSLTQCEREMDRRAESLLGRGNTPIRSPRPAHSWK